MHTPQQHRPWGEVTPDFWSAPADAPVLHDDDPMRTPAHYRERVAHLIHQYAHMPQQASAAADQLACDLAAEYGTRHLHTLNFSDLRGWLLHLSGQHAAALPHYRSIIKTLTRDQMSVPDRDDLVRRACRIWTHLTDIDEAHREGTALLTVLEEAAGPDSPAAQAVRRRLGTLDQRRLPEPTA